MVERPLFWDELKEYVNLFSLFVVSDGLTRFSLKMHLQPLTITVNVTQSNDTRLNVMLLTLGHLHAIYTNSTLKIHSNLCQQVLQSLE